MKNRCVHQKVISVLLSVSLLCSGLFPISARAAETDDPSLCPHHREHTEGCGFFAGTEGSPCAHEHTEGCYTLVTNCIHEHTEDCYPAPEDPELPGGGGSGQEQPDPLPPEGSGQEQPDPLPPEGDGQEQPGSGDPEGGQTAGEVAPRLLAAAAPGEATACPHVCTVDSGCITEELNCQHQHDAECGYEAGLPPQPCGFGCAICPIQARIDALPAAGEPEKMDEGEKAELLAQIQEIKAAITALDADDAAQLDMGPLDALAYFVKEANGITYTIAAGSAELANTNAHITKHSDTEYTISYPGATEGTPLKRDGIFKDHGDNLELSGFTFAAKLDGVEENEQPKSLNLMEANGLDMTELKEAADQNDGDIPEGTYELTLDLSKITSTVPNVKKWMEIGFEDGSQTVNIHVVVGTDWGDSSAFDDYKVTTAALQHVTMDLFDYWVEGQTAHDHPESGAVRNDKSFPTCGIPGCIGDTYRIHEGEYEKTGYYNKGINADHALVFSPAGDLTGGWNFNTNNPNGESQDLFYGGPYYGLVQDRLDKYGYPVLNLDQDEVNEKDGLTYGDQTRPADESLAYLFDPAADTQGRAVYRNVTGLFQVDPNTGNHVYDSRKNFASYNAASKKFDVYNSWAVTGGDTGDGQFFPFNTAAQVFETEEDGTPIEGENGILQPKKEPASSVDNAAYLDHYFGMTMEVEFQQPVGGKVSNGPGDKPMVFEFTGDDDVWIFIDDVLVADIGGIHDAQRATIDFSTGAVKVDRAERFDEQSSTLNENEKKSRRETTITEQFAKALGEQWVQTSGLFDGDTFADGTVHTLKMFYLERGNGASNLILSFNLMEPRHHNISKVDQDGEGLDGVVFDLFKEEEPETIIARLRTEDGGHVKLVKEIAGKEQPIAFEAGKTYILREVANQDGFSTTGDIRLSYDPVYHMLNVANRWETGAVAGFEAQIYQTERLKYQNPAGGGDDANEAGKRGLIAAVPMYNSEAKGALAKGGWRPLYGSVTKGFHLVDVDGSTDAAYKKAVLEAVLRQISDPDYEHWHLEFDENEQRYAGVLRDLPGSIDRYVFIDEENGDMLTAYYLLDLPDVFKTGMTAEEKHEALSAKVEQLLDEDDTGEALLKWIEEQAEGSGIRQLDISQFNRQFYARLYIPNQVRELRVHKRNEDGGPLQGAKFGLYDDAACSGDPLTYGVTDSEGDLTFSAQNTGGEGSSQVGFALARLVDQDGIRQDRSYWLKEIDPPSGYQNNDTAVEVRITRDSLYVNAGREDDGVVVRKGVGKLISTMVRYAADDELNVTLRDITATGYILKDDAFVGFDPSSWERYPDEPLDLHFGLEGAMLDYGLHDTARKPYFETDVGWMAFGITQHYDAHVGTDDEWSQAGGIKNDLRGKDISALLTGTTTVMVTDQKAQVSPPDPGPGGDDTVDVTVRKVWQLDDGGQQPDSVEVELLRDGARHAVVTLNAGNGWTHTWQDLSDSYSWSVGEAEVPDGFTSTVEQTGMTFIITNDDQPDEPTGPGDPDRPTDPDGPDEPTDPDDPDRPTDPDDPDEPGGPDEPDEPDEPDDPDRPTDPAAATDPTDPDGSDGPDEPDQPDAPKLPQTGVRTRWLLAGLLSAAGMALLLLGLYERKRYHGKREA